MESPAAGARSVQPPVTCLNDSRSQPVGGRDRRVVACRANLEDLSRLRETDGRSMLNVVPYKLPSAPSNRFDIGVPSKMGSKESLSNVCRVVRAPAASIANTVPVAPGADALTRCPIELAVACLDHAVRCLSVGSAGELINRGQGPCQVEPDDGATTIGATACRRPVQVPVCSLNQLSRRGASQTLQRRQAPARIDPEQPGNALRHAIEVSVTGFEQIWPGPPSRQRSD